MGVIGNVLSWLFGGGRNVIKQTAEVFRENAEAGASRAQDVQLAAMQGFQAEFRSTTRGRFDRVMDGVNRLPRPAMALGCLALFASAMGDPVWFAARMSGLALVPDPLWWLLGVVVSFYFGARHQAKGQEFQRSIAQSMARVPQVVDTLEDLQAFASPPNTRKKNAQTGATEIATDQDNPALSAWRQAHATKRATK